MTASLFFIAADRDLGLEAWRVFASLNGQLDFENLIVVPQVEIAAALSMKRPAISRAIKLLTDKQIILRGPKLGSGGCFQPERPRGGAGTSHHTCAFTSLRRFVRYRRLRTSCYRRCGLH
jgi:hypothetical protein